MALPRAQFNDFETEPWCRSLLESPRFVRRRVPSQEAPQPNSNQAHSFFSSTLATETALRAVACLEEEATGHLYMIFSISTGLNGPDGIVHGGFIMTLLDAVTALPAHRATQGAVLTTQHVCKSLKKITGPCIILARAWIQSEQESSVVT